MTIANGTRHFENNSQYAKTFILTEIVIHKMTGTFCFYFVFAYCMFTHKN